MATRWIPVSSPDLRGREREYLLDAFDSSWISSKGEYLETFEARFAEFIQAKHAVAVANGTVALHLALVALGVGAGDEVIVPTLTYVATVNAVTYTGATPVLVDVDPVTWNVDIGQVRGAISGRTRAIIVAHLYGRVPNMDALRDVCNDAGVPLLEDAAEAFGAEYGGQRVGSLGTLATFSFYGNKTITTGEGGMVTTNDSELAQRLRVLRNQGVQGRSAYWHEVIGFNYRLTNLQAAIGVAQLERAEYLLERKYYVAAMYRELIRTPMVSCVPEGPFGRSSWWMSSILLEDGLAGKRDAFRAALEARGIETRPFFAPIHTLPPYRGTGNDDYPVAERVAARGINLPSSTTMTDDELVYVSMAVNEAAEELADDES